MSDYDSALALSFDAPMSAPTESGMGAHLRHTDLAWTYTNIVTTPDGKGYFLAPYQGSSAWKSTFTGAGYTRHPLTDWTQTAGTWQQITEGGAADYWTLLAGSTGTLTTAGANWSGGASGLLRANPHLYVEARLDGTWRDTAVVLTVTMGGKWRLSVYGNGDAAWHEYVGAAWEFRVSGPLVNQGTHEHLKILIVPTYRRCLYAVSGGLQLVYEDAGLPFDGTDYTASDAASPMVPSATVAVALSHRGRVQVTELYYAASGTMAASWPLPYAPTQAPLFTDPDGRSLTWKDEPGDSAVTTATTYTPGSGILTMPLTATLAASTDRRSTPVVYAVGVRMDPTDAARDAASTALLSTTMPDSVLDVDGERATLTWTVKSASAIRTKHNRAFLMTCGGDEVFRGYSTDPDIGEWDDRDMVTFTVQDEWKRLDRLMLPNTEAFDGWLATDAVKRVLEYAGYTSARWDIDDSTLRLPNEGGNSTGEALVQPGTGTSVGDWLRQTAGSYLDRFMGFRPIAGTIKFCWKDRASSFTTSAATFYSTVAEAVAAGGDIRDCLTNVRLSTREPECNEIWVIGRLPDGRPIRATWIDAAAQEPTTVEASRPASWVGERRLMILVDAALASQYHCDLAALTLAANTTRALQELTWECEWHPEVNVWDVVTIDGEGDLEGDWRISRYSVRFTRETDLGGRKMRTATYTAERYL